MSNRCGACGDVYKNYAGLVLHKANCIPNLKLEIAELKGEIKSMAIGLGIAEKAIANAELFDKDWHEFSLTNT